MRSLYGVASPLVLFLGGDWNTQEGLAGVTGDLSGVFHSETGGFAYETLPLAGDAPDGAERYFVTDEVYTGRLTAWHSDAEPFTLTFWVIVSWTWQQSVGSYWTVTGAATGSSGGTLLAFALSFSPRKKVAVEVECEDSKGRKVRVRVEYEYESVKTPPLGSISVGAVIYDIETGDRLQIDVAGHIYRTSEPEKKIAFSTFESPTKSVTVQLAPTDDYTAEVTKRTPQTGICRVPLKSAPEKFSIIANASGSIGFLFIRHKGIQGKVWERTSDGRLVELPGATVEVFKGQDFLYETKSQSVGLIGMFEIPALIVDGWLEKYSDGSFTVKVTPPARSMMRPDPLFISRDTPTITKCQRRKTGEPCPRDMTVNLGDFIFSYRPPNSPPGGG